MQYFRNYELAKLYHVSQATVGKWVEAAKQGKLGLTLSTKEGKTYVANTVNNTSIIEQLVADRRKYRNHKAAKTIEPQARFYELYTQQQILDIMVNLEVQHEMPFQYSYFEDGADYWDKYAQRLYEETTPNVLKNIINLLEKNQSYIDDILARYKRVNIVDIGVGNALPVKQLLSHFLETGRLGRYIAIDISEKMLDIAESNVKKWFDGRVAFERYRLDINYDRFTDVLADEYVQEDSKDIANLVLVLGGTFGSFRTPEGAFKIIHDSMGLNDLFIYSKKLDTDTSRRYFDFNLQPGKTALAQNDRFIFDLFNIDESFYDVEMGFDEELSQRFIRARLKVALRIKFYFDNGARFIDLNKGDAILLWRGWQQSAIDVVHQLNQNAFYPLHTSQTDDQELILAISRIKHQ